MDYRALARKLKPRGWTIVEKRLHGPNDGYCQYSEKRIVVPPLDDEYGFFVFAHELGHATLRHDVNPKHYHEREHEANQFAFRTMRANGVRVPRAVLKAVKHNSREALLRDYQRGVICDNKIARWAFS